MYKTPKKGKRPGSRSGIYSSSEASPYSVSFTGRSNRSAKRIRSNKSPTTPQSPRFAHTATTSPSKQYIMEEQQARLTSNRVRHLRRKKEELVRRLAEEKAAKEEEERKHQKRLKRMAMEKKRRRQEEIEREERIRLNRREKQKIELEARKSKEKVEALKANRAASIRNKKTTQRSIRERERQRRIEAVKERKQEFQRDRQRFYEKEEQRILSRQKECQSMRHERDIRDLQKKEKLKRKNARLQRMEEELMAELQKFETIAAQRDQTDE
ncbi:hypothetical protein PCE1_002685 [Barthelona sp. PCE]